MLKVRPRFATTLVLVILLVKIGVEEAKSVNFLERKQAEIDGEDNRKAEIKSNGGELDALQYPFELAAARIRVSVQQLGPSQMAEKDRSKTDSDLVAALPHGPVPTITLTPTNATSVGHRSSPSSAELVDPSMDEYSEDPFDGTGKIGGLRSGGEFKKVADQMLRPPPPSLNP